MSKRSGKNEIVEETTSGDEELFATTEQEGVTADENDQEHVQNEDAIETARRILAGNDTADKEVTAEASEGDTDSVQDKAVKVEKPQAKKAQTIEAPTYIEASDREEWGKLDDESRKMVRKVLDRQNAKFTQRTQEAAQKIQESQAYREHAEMYLNQNPQLIERGYTGPKLLQELLATHMILTGSDKKAAKARWETIGKQAGFTTTSSNVGQENEAQVTDISSHPDFMALQNRVKDLNSDYEARRQQSQQQEINSRMTEFQGIQAETDTSGNFLYPKFHDVEFVRQAKPLALGLVRTMSYTDAWKAAYRALAQTDNSSSSYPAKFPAETKNIQRNAATAAISVRGKSSPQSSNNFGDIPAEAIKKGMTAEETAAYIIRNRN